MSLAGNDVEQGEATRRRAQFDGREVVLASRNRGKLSELAALLSSLEVALRPISDFTELDVEETGCTFIENAILKARHACQVAGLAAIADDSGLEVDALGGAPGVYSARYAGTHGDDAANNARLLAELDGITSAHRTARFRCVMVYMRHAADPSPIVAQATWEGHIGFEPRGSGGFGYDPLFVCARGQVSAAELGAEQKNQRSHRGLAARALLAALRELR